jgi:hypothetical protein
MEGGRSVPSVPETKNSKKKGQSNYAVFFVHVASLQGVFFTGLPGRL